MWTYVHFIRLWNNSFLFLSCKNITSVPNSGRNSGVLAFGCHYVPKCLTRIGRHVVGRFSQSNVCRSRRFSLFCRNYLRLTMNRPIYCFIFLGLPCIALGMSRTGISAIAGPSAAADTLKLSSEEQSLLGRFMTGEHRSNSDFRGFRSKRQDNAENDGDDGRALTDSTTTAHPSAAPSAAPSDDNAAAAAGEGRDSITEIRWITYLFLFAIAILFLLLTAVVTLLSYYILSTRVLNKTTCKEIELQCRCEDCGKENDDGC